jgi:hypothetical protein
MRKRELSHHHLIPVRHGVTCNRGYENGDLDIVALLEQSIGSMRSSPRRINFPYRKQHYSNLYQQHPESTGISNISALQACRRASMPH